MAKKENLKKRNPKSPYLYAYIIVILTFLVYSFSLNNEFLINWDDHLYVTQNDVIKDLSWKTIKEIFTTFHYENYHPLTNLSNAIEYYFFELNPFPYHLVNLLLHLANTLLVFIFICKLLSNTEAAAIVAALFAIHPMHVESVAWVSERKDLLYTLFYLASLISYVNYHNSNFSLKYIIHAGLYFLLSCLSKSAAVSLPVLLLLIDYYKTRKLFSFRVIAEKVPFFIIAFLFGVVAIKSQSSTGATYMVNEQFTILERIFLATYATVFYLVKSVFPINLSALYLYPTKDNGALPFVYYASIVVVLLIAFWIYRSKEIRKELIFGFAFFLITIALMIQLVPVGRAIVAERYTYVAYIGLFFIVAKLYLVGKSQSTGFFKKNAKYVLLVIGVLFSLTTYNRTKVWKDGDALFSDVINKDPSAIAFYNRGYVRQMAGDYKSALDDFNKAIEKDTAYALAYNNRGGAKFFLKDYMGAIEDYTKTILYDTGNVDGYYNRGYVKQQMGDITGALDDYKKSIVKSPSTAATVYLTIGNLKQQQKDYQSAIKEYHNCLAVDSLNYSAYFNLGNTYYYLNKDSMAMENYNKTISVNPDFADAHYNLGMVFLNFNKPDLACGAFKRALNLGKKEAAGLVQQHCR